MEIYLKLGHTFSVPVTVADHLLGLASHDQLKVLLYVLCHADEQLSAAQIAQSCKVGEAAVEEAIVFWQDANVLLSSRPQPAFSLPERESEPEPAPQPLPAAPQPAAPQPAERPQIQASSSNFALMPTEIAERITKNQALAEMFRSAEQYAGRLLNNTEQKSLIWMHEYLGLEPELILLLIAFCVETDQFRPRVTERIAMDWQEQGIRTPEAALADIERRTDSRSYIGQIRSIMEMTRKPTEYQRGFFEAWHRSSYPIELVRYACEKSRNYKNDQISLPYIDKILKSWAESGIRNVAEAKKLDEAFYSEKKRQKAAAAPKKKPAAKSGNFDELQNASIDISDLEKLMNPY